MRSPQKFNRCQQLTMAAMVTAMLGAMPWRLIADTAKPTVKSVGTPTVNDSLQDTETVDLRGMKIHVLDPDGRPLQGVRVFRNHVYTAKVDGRPKIENQEYFTDADGMATIIYSGISVDLRLWATKENYVPFYAMWARKLQSDGNRIPLEFTFQLQRGTEIGGTVENDRGEPISGVKVEVQDRTAVVFHLIDGNRPGIRPVRSHWLTGDKGVLTDPNGRWKIGNVPADNRLVFVGLDKDDPGPRIALRFSHPNYTDSKEWGRLQRDQGITHKSLRDQTATVVLKQPALAP